MRICCTEIYSKTEFVTSIASCKFRYNNTMNTTLIIIR